MSIVPETSLKTPFFDNVHSSVELVEKNFFDTWERIPFAIPIATAHLILGTAGTVCTIALRILTEVVAFVGCKSFFAISVVDLRDDLSKLQNTFLYGSLKGMLAIVPIIGNIGVAILIYNQQQQRILLSNISFLDQEYRTLQHKEKDAQERLQTLNLSHESDVISLKTQIQELKEASAAFNDQQNELEAQITALEAEKTELLQKEKAVLDEAKTLNLNHEAEVTALQTQIQDLQEAAAAFSDQQSELEAQITALEAEKTELLQKEKAVLDEAKTLNLNHEAEVSVLQSQIQDLQEAAAAFRDKQSVLDAQITALEAEKTEVQLKEKAALDEIKNLNLDHESTVTDLQTQLQELKIALEAEKTELLQKEKAAQEELKTITQKHEDEVSTLKTYIKNLQEEATALKTKIGGVKPQGTPLEDKKKSLPIDEWSTHDSLQPILVNHEAGENQDSSKTSPISRSPSPQSEPIDSSPSPSLDNASDDDLVSPVQSDKEGALSNANLSKEPADSKATTDSEVIKSLEAEIRKFKRLHKEDQDTLTYFQNVIHQKDVQIRNLTLRGQRLASLRTPKIKRERKH